MALFKKRSSAPGAADPDPTPESAAAYANPMHRRARHRLIGATVLVVLAVLILPWVFDVKPPTVSTNVPLAIDGQAESLGSAPSHIALAPAPVADDAPAAHTSARHPSQAEPAADARSTAAEATAPASDMPSAQAPKEKADRQAAPPRQVAPAPAARKPASIDELIAQRQAKQQERQPERAKTPAPPGKPATTAPAPAAATTGKADSQATATPPVNYNFPEKGRFVVQIGAYVEADKVANVRKRLAQAGLNNYTQRVTINGKQVTRVRLGPFTSRKQMEQVANKVRAMGLPVSLYQL